MNNNILFKYNIDIIMLCPFNMLQIVETALNVKMDGVTIRNASKMDSAPKATNVRIIFAVR